MSDLVDRLRTVYLQAHQDQIECIAAAADEIERLTAALAEHNGYANDLSLDLMTARAKVEQLEAFAEKLWLEIHGDNQHFHKHLAALQGNDDE